MPAPRHPCQPPCLHLCQIPWRRYRYHVADSTIRQAQRPPRRRTRPTPSCTRSNAAQVPHSPLRATQDTTDPLQTTLRDGQSEPQHRVQESSTTLQPSPELTAVYNAGPRIRSNHPARRHQSAAPRARILHYSAPRHILKWVGSRQHGLRAQLPCSTFGFGISTLSLAI